MRCFLLFLSLCCCLAAASKSVWDGVYSKEQASRGKTAYHENCARCHGENLAGTETAPALAGKHFLEDWNGRTAGDLLAIIAKTMPSDDPGALTGPQYADITASLFEANGFPAGPGELDSTPAAIKDIRIEPRK